MFLLYAFFGGVQKLYSMEIPFGLITWVGKASTVQLCLCSVHKYNIHFSVLPLLYIRKQLDDSLNPAVPPMHVIERGLSAVGSDI